MKLEKLKKKEKPDCFLKGFTLVEILIYLSIMAVIVTSFIIFILSINSSSAKTYVVQEVQANARMALALMAQKIRAADAVISPGNGNADDILVLSMSGLEADLSFSVVNGILGITQGAAGFKAITSSEVNVFSLVFTNLTEAGEKSNIRIEIGVSYSQAGSPEYEYSQNSQTAVSLRQ